MNPDNNNESDFPNDGIDNRRRDDLMVFELEDETYKPAAFMIGWKSGDADIGAWIGGQDLAIRDHTYHYFAVLWYGA